MEMFFVMFMFTLFSNDCCLGEPELNLREARVVGSRDGAPAVVGLDCWFLSGVPLVEMGFNTDLEQKWETRAYLSRVARKLVFGILDQVQHKPACTVKDESYNLEILGICSTKALISFTVFLMTPLYFIMSKTCFSSPVNCLF